MRPFNFTDGPRPAGRSPEERARFYRWNAPGKSRVIHPDHGSVVVPHVSNLAATMNAAASIEDLEEKLEAQTDGEPGI